MRLEAVCKRGAADFAVDGYVTDPPARLHFNFECDALLGQRPFFHYVALIAAFDGVLNERAQSGGKVLRWGCIGAGPAFFFATRVDSTRHILRALGHQSAIISNDFGRSGARRCFLVGLAAARDLVDDRVTVTLTIVASRVFLLLLNAQFGELRRLGYRKMSNSLS